MSPPHPVAKPDFGASHQRMGSARLRMHAVASGFLARTSRWLGACGAQHGRFRPSQGQSRCGAGRGQLFHESKAGSATARAVDRGRADRWRCRGTAPRQRAPGARDLHQRAAASGPATAEPTPQPFHPAGARQALEQDSLAIGNDTVKPTRSPLSASPVACEPCDGHAPSGDGALRCFCGSLLARRVSQGIELKCKRCKRTLIVPLDGSEEGAGPI